MALSRHHAAITLPRSVEEIVHMAQDYDYTNNRSLRAWLRSAQMLLTESAISEQDGNLQLAYLYLYRHADLVLSKLPQHPDFKDAKFKADISKAQKTVSSNLKKLEQWKPHLNQEHQRYAQAMARRNAEKQRVEESRRDDERQRIGDLQSTRQSTGANYGGLDDEAQHLNVNENRRLAVDLAHREIRRRDATRQSTRQAGVSPDTVAARRRGIVVNTPQDGAENDRRRTEDDQVSDGIREAGRHVHRHHNHESDGQDHRNAAAASYRYPHVPTRGDVVDWKTPALRPTPRRSISGPPPSVQAKEVLENGMSSLDLQAPPLPPKSRDPASSSQSLTASLPPSDAQGLPSNYTFKPSAFTERGVPLRTIMLPLDLRTSFLNLAHPNTARNLETCGILCGTLIRNALFINHLIIPDQNSTSDTCDTTEEGDNALFDYCDANSLLVCGWIHTHPSQTCFLSSRDLHTSSGYQVMLPEAIAIVCAPRHNPDWGIFRLTDPPGLKHVLECDQRGLFHPHSETNLYTDALRPGHVVEGEGLQFGVVDLRKG